MKVDLKKGCLSKKNSSTLNPTFKNSNLYKEIKTAKYDFINKVETINDKKENNTKQLFFNADSENFIDHYLEKKSYRNAFFDSSMIFEVLSEISPVFLIEIQRNRSSIKQVYSIKRVKSLKFN